MPDPIRPDSPLGRAKQAAEDGDLDGVRSELPEISEGAHDAQEAADAGDASAAARALTKIGIVLGTTATEIIEILDKIRAAIDLLNALLDLTVGAMFKTDSETTGYPVMLAPNEIVLLQIKLSAEVDKESGGWVVLDNQERITTATVSIEELGGLTLDWVVLNCTFKAIGAGQDSLSADLSYNSGDGTGPDQAGFVSATNDALGLSVERKLMIARYMTNNFQFHLKPAPGVVKYGLNGANLAVVLEVTGFASYRNMTLPLTPVTVTDVGVSV